MKLLALALLTASAAAQSDQQFDLVCTGTTEQTTIDGKTTEPFTATYHIDLAAKRWCEAGCGAIFDIYSVQPASIQLKEPKHVEHPTFPLSQAGSEIDESFISRTTGEYNALFSSGKGLNIMMRSTKGSCEKRPFSGFPKIETKF